MIYKQIEQKNELRELNKVNDKPPYKEKPKRRKRESMRRFWREEGASMIANGERIELEHSAAA